MMLQIDQIHCPHTLAVLRQRRWINMIIVHTITHEMLARVRTFLVENRNELTIP